jgi:hypothetical protein
MDTDHDPMTLWDNPTEDEPVTDEGGPARHAEAEARRTIDAQSDALRSYACAWPWPLP